jgi:hypothetical protein
LDGSETAQKRFDCTVRYDHALQTVVAHMAAQQCHHKLSLIWQQGIEGDSKQAREFWQLRVALEIETQEVTLRAECQASAALGIVHLWSGAGQILTDNSRSMNSARLAQWLRVRLNLHLISEQAFDDVYDEHGRRGPGQALQVAPELDDGLCTDGVKSGAVSEVVEEEIHWENIRVHRYCVAKQCKHLACCWALLCCHCNFPKNTHARLSSLQF